MPTVLPGISQFHHYEHYGFWWNLFADAWFSVDFNTGAAPNNVWSWKVASRADILYVEPYNQVIYFDRPMTYVIMGAPVEQHTYVAGYYTAHVGSVALKYCESWWVGYAELFKDLTAGSFTWNNVYATTAAAFTLPEMNNCWYDQTYMVAMAQFVPADIAQYLSTYVFYDQQLY